MMARDVWERLMFRVALARGPDFIIGSDETGIYLNRWWLIPRNRWFNIYLHQFLRSDDDRALHDHPWFNLSWLIRGSYIEHTISAGGINRKRRRVRGDFKLRPPWAAHRIELDDGDCWTVFITGPRLRSWGFHCPESGWVHWRDFTASDNAGAIGRGCGEPQ